MLKILTYIVDVGILKYKSGRGWPVLSLFMVFTFTTKVHHVHIILGEASLHISWQSTRAVKLSRHPKGCSKYEADPLLF